MRAGAWPRKLFELSGLLLGALALSALALRAIPRPLLIAAGALLVVHAGYGLLVIARARPNNGAYPWLRNWLYLLQRASGALLVIYLPWAALHLHGDLHARFFGIEALWLHAVGLSALALHFGNGLLGAATHLGLRVTPPAARRSDGKAARADHSHESEEPQTVRLKIKRRDAPEAFPHWDELEVPCTDGLTVLGALQSIGPEPRTRDGRAVTPPAFEGACSDRSCGACTMLVNGRVAQACSVRVEDELDPIELRPLSKLPLVRDLIVDRAPVRALFDRAQALPAADEKLYARCLACGACLEACPSFGPHSPFVGAAAIHHARLALATRAPAILDALSESGGVSDCGHAQNCVQVCPAELPLTTSLAEMMRATTQHFFKRAR